MGALASFRRRPVAGTALVAAAAWIIVVAVECYTTPLLNRAGWYGSAVQTVDYAWPGVVAAATLAWLVERATA